MPAENTKTNKEYPKGEFIIRENDLSDCAYIMESGRAEVCKTHQNGEYQVVGVLKRTISLVSLVLLMDFPGQLM